MLKKILVSFIVIVTFEASASNQELETKLYSMIQYSINYESNFDALRNGLSIFEYKRAPEKLEKLLTSPAASVSESYVVNHSVKESPLVMTIQKPDTVTLSIMNSDSQSSKKYISNIQKAFSLERMHFEKTGFQEYIFFKDSLGNGFIFSISSIPGNEVFGVSVMPKKTMELADKNSIEYRRCALEGQVFYLIDIGDELSVLSRAASGYEEKKFKISGDANYFCNKLDKSYCISLHGNTAKFINPVRNLSLICKSTSEEAMLKEFRPFN